jgi:hypothetical protein
MCRDILDIALAARLRDALTVEALPARHAHVRKRQHAVIKS